MKILAALLAAGLVFAQSPEDPAPVELTGTLAKVRAARALTVAYRESSVPFSYLSPRGEPIGYSIEICRKLAEAIGDAVGRELELKWLPVTSETRIEAIVAGRADLECGSTTNNLERQKHVTFSPIIFVAGTKLLVRRGAPLQDRRSAVERARSRPVLCRTGSRPRRCLRLRRRAALWPRRPAQGAAAVSGGRRIPFLRSLRHHVRQGRRAARRAGEARLPRSRRRWRNRAPVQALVPAASAFRPKPRPADESAARGTDTGNGGEARVANRSPDPTERGPLRRAGASIPVRRAALPSSRRSGRGSNTRGCSRRDCRPR